LPTGSEAEVKVKVRSLLPARLIVTDTLSGTRYEWASGGDIQMVEPVDVPALLARNRSNACCGASGGHNPFEVIE
jgi:hypothetical protein